MDPLRRYLPQIAFIIVTIGCILISIYSFQNGNTIIYQNIFFIPIILASIFFLRKGFLISCLLALLYYWLAIEFSQTPIALSYVFFRVILYVSIAGIVTFLAESLKKSEESLGQMSKIHENLVSNDQVWFMILDLEGKVHLWNTAAEKISGYSADEVVENNDIWKLLYPQTENRNHITETIIQIIKDKKYLENFETTIRTKDGTDKVISWNTKGMADQTGAVYQYMAIGINVTNQYQADLKVQKSEERFRQLFDENVAGYALHEIILDSSGTPVDYRFLEVNPAFERFTGLKRDDIIGKRVLEVLPNTESYWIQTYGQVATTGLSAHFENFSAELGKYYEVTAYSPVLGQFATLILDITNRKLTEIALQESEERLQLTLNATNDGIWDWNIPTGSAIFSSPWYTMLGYEPDEFPATYHAWESLIHPDDLLLVKQKIQDHITQKDEGYAAEVRMLTKYGDYKWILTRGKVVKRSETGEPIRMVGTHTDISDRKKAEQDLRESQQQLKFALDGSNDGVWDVALETGSVYISPRGCEILGYRAEEMASIVQVWSQLVHPDDMPATVQALNTHLEGKTPIFQIEQRLQTKTGGWKWILTRGKVIAFDSEGNPVRMVGTHTDISDRKQIEDELAKKHFALMASYEQIAASEEELKQNIFELSQSEQMLRISEDRLVMAQEIGHVGSWEYILETGQIWGSAEGFRIYGFPPVAGEMDIEKIEACIPERYRVHQALEDLISQGDAYDIEFTINPVDGSSPKVIHSIAIIEKDEEGNPFKIRGVIQDITNLKKNEAALRETNDYLENLINLANVPIIVWDSEFRITRLNRACEILTGRKKEETIGHTLEILFPPLQLDRSMRLIHTTREGVRWETVELEIQHVNGSIRTVVWNSSTLYSPDGISPIATIAQGRDVTDQKTLENERGIALEQIKQNLAQLAILNDGIRNPLTIINISAENIENSVISYQILDQIKRIDEMVHQLDLRWIESEKVLKYLKRHHQISFKSQVKEFKPDELMVFRPDTLNSDSPVFIQEVQAELYTILDSVDAMIYVADMNNHEILFMNRRGRKLYGDIVGKKCYEIIQCDQQEICPFCTNPHLTDQNGNPTGVYQWEFQNAKNGRWFDCRDRAIHWVDGRIVKLEIATDITGRKKTEEKLKSVTRLYVLLSQINHAIVRTRSKPDLFNAICQVAAEYGEFSLAWIGLYDEADNRIKPVCHAGKDDGYLDSIDITIGKPSGEGPTGLAFSEGRIITSSDIATDPRMIPWREEALKRGYHSSAAVPLRQRGEIIGVFSFYATEHEFFTIDEQSLLERIGEEISFALDSIDLETEHRKVEEMLAVRTADLDQQIHLLNTLFETVPIGIFMVEVPSGRPLLANREAISLLGPELLPDITMSNLSKPYEAYKTGTSDRYPLHEVPIIRGMRGESSHIDDMDVVRPDGTRINIEVFGNPVMDNQGRIFASLVCFIDISERKRIEQALRESEENHRILVEEISDPFFSLSSDGQYLFANQALAEGFGIPVEDIVGRTMWDFFPKIEADRHFTFLSEVILTGEKKIIEGPVVSEAGTRYYVTTITPIKDQNGKVLYAICSSKNITERKQMEEALQEAILKFHMLIGITRHDVVNQLSVIKGCQYLAIETSDIKKVHSYITQTLEECNRLEATIQFTAEYENFGTVSSTWQRVHMLIELAKDVVSFCEITINNQIPGDIEIYADPIIRKVFSTLLDNAVRHGGDITFIAFYCVKHEDSLIITCEDDGIGIPDGQKKYIFNNGYGKNTGIGLFLAREILSITGLSITECGVEGKGAKFEIVVPPGKFRRQENDH